MKNTLSILNITQETNAFDLLTNGSNIVKPNKNINNSPSHYHYLKSELKIAYQDLLKKSKLS